MAKQFLTLADLAARRGTDKEVGLVQQIVNYSPEITSIIGRSIPGTFTESRVQVGIPKGGGFRAINSGSDLSAGTYEKRRFNCFFWDQPLQIDEAELVAAQQIGDSLGELQADEVSGALMNKAIKFSQQFYNGADANGYPGLLQILKAYGGLDGKNEGVVDSRTGKTLVNVIDAGGTGNNTETIYYVWAAPQGVHFLFGGDSTVDVNPWVWQYVNDAAGKRFRASVSNVKGWIGLSCAHPFAVSVIKNVTALKPWTDALSAQLHALLPVGIQPNFCFATKRSRGLLQQSRTVALFGQAGIARKGDQSDATIAAVPAVDIEGVPIVPTDGIQLQPAW